MNWPVVCQLEICHTSTCGTGGMTYNMEVVQRRSDLVIDEQLIAITKRLKEAVDVCYTAPDKEGQGYPYATGYSRSAMQGAIEDLSRLVKYLQTDDY